MRSSKGNGGNGSITGPLDDALMKAVAEDAEIEGRFQEERERLAALGNKATHEDRLRAYRAAREANVFPPDAGFYLVALVLGNLAWDRIMEDSVLRHLNTFVQESAEVSEEGATLESAWDRISDYIKVATFLATGEPKIATLFVANREEFDRRFENGRCFFFGPLPA